MGNATRNIAPSHGPRQNRKYSIIIPAAGLGVRMKKYGPKSLTKITKTETILSRQLKIINNTFRWYEIILVTGFLHDKVQQNVPKHVKLVYNSNYEDTNIAHSLGLGLKQRSTNNVIILYGDLVFNKHIFNLQLHQTSCAVLADSMKTEEIGCNVDEGYLQQMFYDINNKWGQILFLQDNELDMMTELTNNSDNAMCFGFEIVNKILEHNGKFQTIKPNKAKILDIDTSLDLRHIGHII